jgi:hypothetical protein
MTLVNILDFGPTPQGSGGGSPPPPTGTDYLGHQPPILIGLTRPFIDFGWTPQGTGGSTPPPPTGTDYIEHDRPILIGLSRQVIDFGWLPEGSGGAPPPPPPPPVGIDAGSSISGGYFSRGRWHALIGEQIERAEEKARRLKHKKQSEALLAAAQAAEEFLESLPPEADAGAEALAQTLQAAVNSKEANASIEQLGMVRREAIRLKQILDDDEDLAILMLLS